MNRMDRKFALAQRSFPAGQRAERSPVFGLVGWETHGDRAVRMALIRHLFPPGGHEMSLTHATRFFFLPLGFFFSFLLLTFIRV